MLVLVIVLVIDFLIVIPSRAPGTCGIDYYYDYKHEHDVRRQLSPSAPRHSTPTRTRRRGRGWPHHHFPFCPLPLFPLLQETLAHDNRLWQATPAGRRFVLVIVLVIDFVIVIPSPAPGSGGIDYDYEHEHEHDVLRGLWRVNGRLR